MSRSAPIHCVSCGRALPEADVSAAIGVASCSACGTVFEIYGAQPEPQPEPEPQPRKKTKAKKREALLDEPDPSVTALTARGPAGSWEHSYAWRGPELIFMIFFAVFWNGFMAFWYTMALSQGLWVMAMAGTLHLLIGVGLMLWIAVALVNHTTIRIHGGRLTVTHAPIPWRGALDVETSDVKKLRVERGVNRGKNTTTVHYRVEAQLGSGRRVTIFGPGSSEDEARDVRDRLAEALGLTEEPRPKPHGGAQYVRLSDLRE